MITGMLACSARLCLTLHSKHGSRLQCSANFVLQADRLVDALGQLSCSQTKNTPTRRCHPLHYNCPSLLANFAFVQGNTLFQHPLIYTLLCVSQRLRPVVKELEDGHQVLTHHIAVPLAWGGTI